MKKTDNNIEFVVLRCFIRVIKEDGTYLYFRDGIKDDSVVGYILRKRNCRPMQHDNPFATSSAIDDVVKVLSTITKDMNSHNGKKHIDRYEHVTMTINHLLHFFMEANGLSMDKLCRLGEEIYNLSCNKLFGDTLEDLEQYDEKPEEINDINQLKAKLFHDYINDVESGQLSHKMPFDDYLKVHIKEFERFREKSMESDSFMGEGQMLGKMPDSEIVNNGNWFTTTGWT